MKSFTSLPLHSLQIKVLSNFCPNKDIVYTNYWVSIPKFLSYDILCKRLSSSYQSDLTNCYLIIIKAFSCIENNCLIFVLKKIFCCCLLFCESLYVKVLFRPLKHYLLKFCLTTKLTDHDLERGQMPLVTIA